MTGQRGDALPGPGAAAAAAPEDPCGSDPVQPLTGAGIVAGPHASTLRRVSHVGAYPGSPAADLRGRRVIDAGGAVVGEVDDLYVDDREGRVRFLLVVAGGFPGPCEAEYLIPVGVVARVGDRAVHLDRARDAVAAAPAYSPQLVTEAYLRELCRHYGVRPYWEADAPTPPARDDRTE